MMNLSEILFNEARPLEFKIKTPEMYNVAMNEIKYDKCDVWALGHILFELFYGYKPFEMSEEEEMNEKMFDSFKSMQCIQELID
jgi:serine/threonine protein kinase